MLKLMYITNDVEVAAIADEAGVDRIWIDLESKGKEARQRDLDTVKSLHSVSDILLIKPRLRRSEMLVRVNSMNPDSYDEINEVIDAGADVVMLPYYKTNEEVASFIEFVDNRARVVLLLETKEAAEILPQTLSISGIDEIHIGLNDLHLSLGLEFMFETVANGYVESLCSQIATAGIPYGFGGIARLGSGLVPAEMVINEHYRLGSSRAILSRGFFSRTSGKDLGSLEYEFRTELERIRDYEKMIMNRGMGFFDTAHDEFTRLVRGIANERREKNASV